MLLGLTKTSCYSCLLFMKLFSITDDFLQVPVQGVRIALPVEEPLNLCQRLVLLQQVITYLRNKSSSSIKKSFHIRFFVSNNLDASIIASAQSPSGDATCSGGSGGLIRLKAQQVFCSKSHLRTQWIRITSKIMRQSSNESNNHSLLSLILVSTPTN